MNNQVKSIVVQWIVPALALVLALIVMFINFSAKSEVEANDTVTKNITMMAERSAYNFKEEILSMVKVGEPLADILGDESDLSSAYVVQLLETAMKYSGAYRIYACDENGNGISDTGEKVSLSERDYFEAVSESDEVRYVYTMDVEPEETETMIAAIPIISGEEEAGYLLLLYQLDQFPSVVKNVDFTAWNSATLIDRRGMVVAVTGKGTKWIHGDNIFSELQKDNAAAVNNIKSRVNTNTSGSVAVKMYDMYNTLVYAPVGIGDLVLVVGVSQLYIDNRVKAQLSNFRSMIIQLIIVICVFIVLVVIISIISRLFNSKKQKQLEEKADTDLLTGLNNKLATERKIKEFIAQNPNAQSMMFILDIDNFKKINDTMGHAFGDEVLRSLGEQISVIFRSSDIVGRAGGDEFIVFLKNISDPAAIRKEAKKVENFFKNFKAGEYTKYAATASIGVAIYPEEGADFESIYKAADSALYKAKKGGKNQLAFYKEKWLEEEQN